MSKTTQIYKLLEPFSSTEKLNGILYTCSMSLNSAAQRDLAKAITDQLGLSDLLAVKEYVEGVYLNRKIEAALVDYVRIDYD